MYVHFICTFYTIFISTPGWVDNKLKNKLLKKSIDKPIGTHNGITCTMETLRIISIDSSVMIHHY